MITPTSSKSFKVNSSESELVAALQNSRKSSVQNITTTDQLCAAAYLGDEEVVKELLSSGASANCCSMVSISTFCVLMTSVVVCLT
jgi:hypothetical protein